MDNFLAAICMIGLDKPYVFIDQKLRKWKSYQIVKLNNP